jgi:hypothetical protein
VLTSVFSEPTGGSRLVTVDRERERASDPFAANYGRPEGVSTNAIVECVDRCANRQNVIMKINKLTSSIPHFSSSKGSVDFQSEMMSIYIIYMDQQHNSN